MRSAQIILLNKMDAVPNDRFPRLEALIKTFPHDAHLHRVSAQSGLTDEILAGIL
jgi:G3E family GTPase